MEDKLKVVVRIRPFLPNENASNTGIKIDSDNSQKIEISKSLKKFSATFDKILSSYSTQKDVFNFIKPCMQLIKQGINCTVLAYGQTGSGKTYTMFGGEWALNDKSTDYKQRKKFVKDKYNFILNEELTIDPFSKTNGIIPNLIMNLFQTYGSYETSESNIIITCSYIQIYNEQVYDLLIDKGSEDKEETHDSMRESNTKSRYSPKLQSRLRSSLPPPLNKNIIDTPTPSSGTPTQTPTPTPTPTPIPGKNKKSSKDIIKINNLNAFDSKLDIHLANISSKLPHNTLHKLQIFLYYLSQVLRYSFFLNQYLLL